MAMLLRQGVDPFLLLNLVTIVASGELLLNLLLPELTAGKAKLLKVRTVLFERLYTVFGVSG